MCLHAICFIACIHPQSSHLIVIHCVSVLVSISIHFLLFVSFFFKYSKSHSFCHCSIRATTNQDQVSEEISTQGITGNLSPNPFIMKFPLKLVLKTGYFIGHFQFRVCFGSTGERNSLLPWSPNFVAMPLDSSSHEVIACCCGLFYFIFFC